MPKLTKKSPLPLLRTLLCLMLCIVLLSPLASCANANPAPEQIVIRLAAPQNAYIEDFDTNMYKLWLEVQTGLRIEMTWLPTNDAEQIAKLALATGEDLPDAYVGFGSSSYDIFQGSNIQRYGEQGSIIALDELIEEYGLNTKDLFDELGEYDFEQLMTSADGHKYFMPGFSSSVITRYRQLMWVNKGWLSALGIEPPTTTDEFREMLLAFKTYYPHGIPLAGTEAHYSKQAYDYLFNAFIYNDMNNSRLLLENGVVGFAPIRNEYRDALKYMRGLYDDGLYSPLSFTQDNQQMNQMANDPRDILGAFLSPGITLTVYQNSPEVMERYVGIGPLMGPEGVRLSSVFTSIPRPFGVITSSCQYPVEVFKLFDLMLSREACLMGRYGEKGVDWNFAEDDSVSIYGTTSTIRIINQIWNTTQNKHLSQIVPYVSRPVYSGGVTWDGNTIDGEYMNAQAAMLFREYEPDEFIGTLILTPDEELRIQNIRSDIDTYVNDNIVSFITGMLDIHNDAVWSGYVTAFDNLGLQEFLTVAQTAHNRSVGIEH